MWHGLSRWLLVLCVLAGSTLALASSYPSRGYRMMHSSYSPFRYYVDDRQPTPAGIAIAEVRKAVDGAYQAWAGVACAHPAFAAAGVTSSLSLTNVNDSRDRYNVTPVFITDKNDPAYEKVLGSGSRPMDSVRLTFGGNLYQCDIFVDATGDYRWSTFTPTQAGFLDLQTFLTREIGRCMGLDDVTEADAVMGGLSEGVMRRALSQHDKDHLCALYPQAGQVGTPCSASGTCTGELTCVTAPEANGLPGYRMCTKGCSNTTPGECPVPLACKASTAVAGAQYACLQNMADFVTRVGNACTTEPQCNSPWGECLQPVTLPSSTTAWAGGYCTQQCTSAQGPCPAGSKCVGMEIGPKCLKECRLGGTDCRSGYVCLARPEGNVCVSACSGDSDCGSGYACRQCDKICVPQQRPGGSIGDTCNADADCGTFQKCLKRTGDTQGQGVCSQTCGHGTCSCPDGTTCQKVGTSGASMCVRTCSQGTCLSGQQCAPFSATVAGCLPPCRTSVDCPAGSTCGSGGQCVSGTGSPDAGCPLCGGGDAGTVPPVPPAPDAGTDPGGPAGPGCGCQGSGVNAPGFLGALVLFLVASRRRRCQRP
jgi:MYXO-CTERM domain-containing protein